ncbi:hypothetical protein J6590_002365 [Homalodisca vitripennis]|nr:hypothetical protein J6590_002365 [Homalodisca vitripennis]
MGINWALLRAAQMAAANRIHQNLLRHDSVDRFSHDPASMLRHDRVDKFRHDPVDVLRHDTSSALRKDLMGRFRHDPIDMLGHDPVDRSKHDSADMLRLDDVDKSRPRPTRAYSCISCKRSYTHKCDLIRHQRQVCGKEPQFKCRQCDKRCFYKYALLSHIRHRHPENPATTALY